MRAILAGLFFYIAMLFGADLIFDFDNENVQISKIETIFQYFALFIYLAVILALSTIIFNKNGWRNFKNQSIEEYVKELEEQGKLIKESYEHKRSLSFEDLSTGSLVFFIETNNNNVLCLVGQYLYEYSEITDDDELNQERQFPTINFTLLKNIDDGELVDIELQGEVADNLVFSEPDYALLQDITGVELYKLDGKVIPNITFEQILNLWEQAKINT